MKDSLIVLSGGMDSTTMLHEYSQRIAAAVNFSYGANHNMPERQCARANCQLLGIPLIELDLPFIGQHFQSSLLSGPDAIPTGQYDDTNIHSTIVPFRNGIMLAIAAGLAESRHLPYIMIANHAGDHIIYPDCTPAFIQAMNSAITAGTFDTVTLLAPYTHLTKAQIACRGAALGIDYSLTYSCYKGTPQPCGECATCIERAQALRAAGIEP